MSKSSFSKLFFYSYLASLLLIILQNQPLNSFVLSSQLSPLRPCVFCCWDIPLLSLDMLVSCSPLISLNSFIHLFTKRLFHQALAVVIARQTRFSSAFEEYIFQFVLLLSIAYICLPSCLDFLTCTQMSPIYDSVFSLLPDGIFQNATLVSMLLLCLAVFLCRPVYVNQNWAKHPGFWWYPTP